jgi:predicted GH43/DUF377 family glycosyl hydrolase
MKARMLDSGARLDPDPTRVILRLFLPGEEARDGHPRVSDVVARLFERPNGTDAESAKAILDSFGQRTGNLKAVLLDHAAAVSPHADRWAEMNEDERLLLGATFSAEYAIEGAALCNPSAVTHPDQGGLEPGQLRVAVSLRSIGEGHVSSIGFVSAVIGPGRSWTFGPRTLPLTQHTLGAPRWSLEHFVDLLEQHRLLNDEIAQAVVRSLAASFGPVELEEAIAALPPQLTQRHDAAPHIEALRTMVNTAYSVEFPESSELAQRLLMPVAHEEIRGVEDARFVYFAEEDGRREYRATYTAYDGNRIAPRLLTSPDLRSFESHRLSGSAARNKGIALFPRKVGGRYLALTRSDGENSSLAWSEDGRVWTHKTPVHVPRRLWEIVKTGNCGAPIETDRGWLVITHGVGPMRRYCIGAILLDIEHPDKVLARLECPLLEPDDAERNGYVPNVVYSCGGVVHEGVLWLPYGVADAHIRVASIPVTELLDAMTPVNGAAAPC